MKNVAVVFAIIILITVSFCNQSMSNAPGGAMKTLEIKGDELRVVPRKARILIYFEPDRSVKRAEYDTYVFDFDEFHDKIGNHEKVRTVKAEVRITKTTEDQVQPAEGSISQSPDGGIRIVKHECEIVRVISD